MFVGRALTEFGGLPCDLRAGVGEATCAGDGAVKIQRESDDLISPPAGMPWHPPSC